MFRCRAYKRQVAAIAVLVAALFLGPSPVPAQGNETALAGSAARYELPSLFTPSFRYKEVKVARNNDGQILLTIVADEPLNPKKIRAFGEALLARSISIYGPTYFGAFSWGRTADKAAITLTRRARDLPDVIEVSESIVAQPKGTQPVVALTIADGNVYIPLSPHFGKDWTRIAVFPGSEPAVSEPKTGRYPGARLRQAIQGEGGERSLFYAYRGNIAEAAAFFHERLKQAHKTVIVSGDPAGPSSQTEVFGIKTVGRVVTLTGYSYASQRLTYTAVTLRKAEDPVLSEYVEIEVSEN